MASMVIRPIHLDGNVAYVTLTKGYIASISATDLHVAEGKNWSAKVDRRSDGSIRSVYAYRTSYLNGRKVVYLHREIMSARPEEIIDHIDGNGLNNVRSNLRIATPSQNQHNRVANIGSASKYKGVSAGNRPGVWRARIKKNGVEKTIGYFDSEKKAHEAYIAASDLMHGSYSRH